MIKYTITLLFTVLLLSNCVSFTKKNNQTPITQYPTTPSVPQNSTSSLNNTGSRLSSDDANLLLTLHNQVRANVGVAPLSWSTAAATHIQEWVDHLALTNCNLQHRPNNIYGENLFMGTVGYYGIEDAVKSWESEKKDYDNQPLTNTSFSGVGHYTQMVWRNTHQVGCATAVCEKTLIVGCNYDPAGNYIGQTPY